MYFTTETYKYRKYIRIHKMQSKVVTIRLDPETYERAREVAEKEHISMSALLKRALDSYLSREVGSRRMSVEVLSRLNDLEKKYLLLFNRMKILEERLKREE